MQLTESFRILLAGITMLAGFCACPGFAQTRGIIEFSAFGKVQKGLALVDVSQEMIVLGRDGWIHSFDPRSPDSQWQRITNEPFEVATAAEMRNALRSEFGKSYEVLSTKHFLVVQPRGRGERWPKLFEQSHRSFVGYMTKRGVNIRKGRFPMVAVVFPDEAAMRTEFDRLSIDVGRVAGLHAVNSNRVMTHDGARTASVMATVRHEAAHQSAFNSGAHSRVNDTPRWISEGVGQMFEPEAMTDPRGASQLADRVNRESLVYLRQNNMTSNSDRFVQTAAEIIRGDMMFKNEKLIKEAYAVAWALMFYLAERQPKAFAQLLNETAGRRPFQTYQPSDRIMDFERIVGVKTLEFSKKVARYLESL